MYYHQMYSLIFVLYDCPLEFVIVETVYSFVFGVKWKIEIVLALLRLIIFLFWVVVESFSAIFVRQVQYSLLPV